jgi:hypothetical protein
VAVGVVDRLEVVDVDEGDRQRPLVAVRPLDLGEQRGEERARLLTPVRRSIVAASVVSARRRRASSARARRPSSPPPRLRADVTPSSPSASRSAA